MERLLSSIQATHQVQAFKYSGVRMDSQEAYELAAAGTVRPADKSPMLIYNIRCTEFDLPFFTLEVSCLNENASYLLQLVHDIGLRLRSCALCHRVRQVRYGQVRTGPRPAQEALEPRAPSSTNIQPLPAFR
uniref:Putative pseudouridine synthase n=1 Tax=Ixodes ricinus TaxID=34613 RepID=V5H7B7_IXORI